MKTYNVYAVRNGQEYKMNVTPMTHKEACIFKCQFIPKLKTTYKIKEVRK